jgi:hypothetical protein
VDPEVVTGNDGLAKYAVFHVVEADKGKFESEPASVE